MAPGAWELGRREVLGGLLALGALPWALIARATSQVDPGGQPDIVRHVQDVMLHFDLGEVVARLAERIGLPRRHLRAWRDVAGDRFAGLGFGAWDLLEEDEALGRAVGEVLSRAMGDARVRLRLRRLIKRLPRDPSVVPGLVDGYATELFDLDVAGLHAHAEGLERDGLLIVYGGVRDGLEVLSLFASHLMTRFLEAVHGRRAKVVYASDIEGMLREVVDPSVRVVAFFGHGTWSSFSLGPVAGSPEVLWPKLVSALDDDPQGTLAALQSGQLYRLFPWDRSRLHEEELAKLWEVWFADEASAAAARKDLVVRYTCATERFEVESRLLWWLLPDALAERSHTRPWSQRIAPEHPEDASDWDEAMATFLEAHPAEVEERVALGTSLVRDPRDTRGYRGLTWTDDFIRTPIPPAAHRPSWLSDEPPVAEDQLEDEGRPAD